MDDPQKTLWNIFCALVRPSTLENDRMFLIPSLYKLHEIQ